MNCITRPDIKTKAIRQRQPQPQTVEVLRDLEQFIQKMEAEGCPEATAAQLRESIKIALAQTLAESKRRDFLLRQIKQNVKRLRPKRFSSDFPEEAPDALRKIEGYAKQLPDVSERERILRWVRKLRSCFPVEYGK